MLAAVAEAPNESADAAARGVEPRVRVTEIFFSLQGEADSVGWPTVFVRLTGCPLRCTWCDTGYAFHGGEWRTIDEIAETVRDYGARHVCVTGGEPLAQKRCIALLFGFVVFSAASAQQAPYEAGKQYFLVEPPQPTTTGDKVEVVEVFSYACPACNAFVPFVELFAVEEGRLGVVVTFMAVLELIKESLVELVQNEPFAAIHVRARAE